MSERFRRYFIKAKNAQILLREASQTLKIELEEIFKSKPDIEVAETDFANIYLINGKPLLAKVEGKILPTLLFNELSNLLSKVVVNMGAVPRVCNGADVMAPGIVRFEGKFQKGDFVLVVDEKHGKPIAVGKIIYDSDEAEKIKRGPVVKNFHFVGDKIWNFIKRFEV
jgi:PUA domain protein